MKIYIVSFCLVIALIVFAYLTLSSGDIFLIKTRAIYLTLCRTFSENPPDEGRNEDKLDNATPTEIQIRQVLQQRFMESVNKQDELAGNSSEPGNKKMIEGAITDLYSSKHQQDRELAIMTLGEYSTPEAKDGILFALDDPEFIVRQQAVIQISKWPNINERSTMLLTALKNDNPDILVQTLESIRETESLVLMDRLNQLSSNKNKDIRRAAKMALTMIEE